MSLRAVWAAVFGICCGSVTSAGVFALISVVGIIPRMAGFSHTGKRIRAYEWAVILGGSLANLWYFLRPTVSLYPWAAAVLEVLIGLGMGMFVGSLAMALAEILQVFPIMIRRTRLKVGTRYLSLALALGKMVGSIWYFLQR